MAKTSMKIKQQRKPKFTTQAYTRCIRERFPASRKQVGRKEEKDNDE